MKHSILSIFLLLLLLLTGSCISEFQAELPGKEDDILVISGDIVENTEVEIVLSKSFSVNSPTPPAESQNIAATITLVGSDGTKSQPATSMGSGVFRLDVGELKDDVAYGIRIEYYGNVYTSELSEPLHTPEIDEITWAQPEKYGDVGLRVSTHDDTSSEPGYYMWNYQEDWEFPAWRYTRLYVRRLLNGDAIIDTLDYNYKSYCWKKNTINKLLIGSTEMLIENRLVDHQLLDYPSGDDRFRSLYCLTLSQKAISKEAYDYYSAKRTENEEMGGLFTPQPNEVKGNIVCRTDPSKRTIGYISVIKNVARKRLFVDQGEISRDVPNGCPLMEEKDIRDEMAKAGYDGDKFEEYLLLEKLEPVGDWEKIGAFGEVKTEVYGYVKRPCVDCVLSGGSKNKPAFWPNDHK